MTRNLKVQIGLLTKEARWIDGQLTQILDTLHHQQSEVRKVLSGGYGQHSNCQERGNLLVRYLCNVGHLLHSNHDDSDTEMIHVCCYISLSPERHSYVVQWYTRQYLIRGGIKQQKMTNWMTNEVFCHVMWLPVWHRSPRSPDGHTQTCLLIVWL